MTTAGQHEHDPPLGGGAGSRRKVRFRGLPTVGGLLVTPILLFIVVMTGGVSGSYSLAKTLFPWTMMSTAVTRSIVQPYIALAVVQYPIYGIIFDIARARGQAGGPHSSGRALRRHHTGVLDREPFVHAIAAHDGQPSANRCPEVSTFPMED